MMRAVKIIATWGPGCWREGVAAEMMEAGCDCFRINLSHCDEADAEEAIRRLRKAAAARHVAVMADLPGVKMRLRTDGPILLREGERLEVRRDGPCRIEVWPVFAGSPVGGAALLHDGSMEMRVAEASSDRMLLEARTECAFEGGEGIAFPGAGVDLPAITERDERWLRWLPKMRPDWVALSFVRDRDDVARARAALGGRVGLMAKIERAEAVERIDSILEVADGLMVARGDLGLSVGLVGLPLLQKKLIRTAVRRDRVSVVATQMLESMTRNRLPTRAEVLDVANAILDGADALLLTDETAVGRYPVDVVRQVARIAERVESEVSAVEESEVSGVADAVCDAAVRAAVDVDAAAIACFTETGRTAVLLSRYFPRVPIYALTDSAATCRRLALVRGVVALELPRFGMMEEMVVDAEAALLGAGLQKGAAVVFVSGTPVGVPGRTDALHIRHLGA